MFNLFIINTRKYQIYLKSIFALLIFLFLSGCLPTIFAGSAGSAFEFAKDRPAEETLRDTRISLSIKKSLMTSGFRNLYSKIKIEVVKSRVLLTGDIEKEEDAIKAVQIAWSQDGVVEVINELKVDKNSNYFDLVQYTKDAFITSQIKSKTFMNRTIKFVNYTVITINNVVYLFGIARSEEELTKVTDIASYTRGVKKVVSHVTIQSVNDKEVNPGSDEFLIDQDKNLL